MAIKTNAMIVFSNITALLVTQLFISEKKN
jgi:hypothetical protein